MFLQDALEELKKPVISSNRLEKRLVQERSKTVHPNMNLLRLSNVYSDFMIKKSHINVLFLGK